MSTAQQTGRAAQAPVAAPRRLLKPVPAPRQSQEPMLLKQVLCSAPCCVQAREDERPLGPDVPNQVPLPAAQAGEEPGQEPPNPTTAKLGHKRRQKKRKEKFKKRLGEEEVKKKLEEERIKKRLVLMND